MTLKKNNKKGSGGKKKGKKSEPQTVELNSEKKGHPKSGGEAILSTQNDPVSFPQQNHSSQIEIQEAKPVSHGSFEAESEEPHVPKSSDGQVKKDFPVENELPKDTENSTKGDIPSEQNSQAVRDLETNLDVAEESILPKEYLGFTVSNEEYAIDIMMIKEIIKTIEITRVPRSSNLILGIISLRGTVLPVLDVKKKLGLREGPMDLQARIVVISSNNGLVGLMVDSVTGVIRMPDSEIEPAPVTLNQIEAEFIKGVGQFRDRMVILLNTDKILSSQELKPTSLASLQNV